MLPSSAVQRSHLFRAEAPHGKVEALQDLPPRIAAVEAQIVQLRAEMTSGFSALSYAINRMHTEIMGRFESIDRRFEAFDKRFERVDRRLDAMDTRFDAIDARFDTMDRRFDAQDVEIAAIKQRIL